MTSRRAFGLTAAIFAIGVLVASQIPNVWAMRVQRRHYHPDLVFMGTLPVYMDDATADWSFMDQARNGRVLLEDLYTADPHPRTYVNSLLWLLGVASRVTGADLPATYNVAKVVFCAVMLAVLWALSCRLFEKPGARLACFMMMIMTGGWEGPIAFLQRHAGVSWSASSPGWWMPEISTMFSMMLFPHLVAGFAAIAGALLLMLHAWERDDTRASIVAGLIVAVLTLFHPYDSVTALGTIWTAPLAFGLAERSLSRRAFFHAAIASAVTLPAIVYDLFLLRTNPAIRAWDLQNVMETPDARALVMAFGVNLVLAALVLPRIRSLNRAQLVMLAWAVSVLVMIQLPVRFQRRMMGGLQIPLAALGCTALALLLARLRRPDALGTKTLATALVLAPLYAVTPCYVHQEQWRELRRTKYPSWLPVEEHALLVKLGEIAPAGSRAIASYPIGNFVPAVSGIGAFWGHPALTVDARARGEDVKRFYAGGPEDDGWRQELLAHWKIGYVISTPRERAMGPFDPSGKPWLEEVFAGGADPQTRAALYKVR